MKATKRYRRFIVWLIWVLGTAPACKSQVNGDVNSFDREWRGIETFWPNQAGNYCDAYNKLLTALQSRKAAGSNLSALEKVASLILDKDGVGVFAGDQESMGKLLWLQKKAVNSLLVGGQSANASPDDRLRYGKTVSAFAERLNKSIIPNYSWKLVTPNVMPPVGSGLRIAGMDPAAIKDPAARGAYEAAIAKNQADNIMNSSQDQTRQTLRLVDFMLSGFLEDTVRKYPDSKSRANDLIAKVAANETELESGKIVYPKQ